MTAYLHATEWHGTRAAIVSNTNLITEYAINCDTPNGRMKTFHLFPGIDYALTTFEASSCDYRKEPVSSILEIAYCKSGRFIFSRSDSAAEKHVEFAQAQTSQIVCALPRTNATVSKVHTLFNCCILGTV